VADVYELAGALRRAGDAIAGEVGQTQARWQLLSVISEGTWTVPAAARRLGTSRQAVQRLADLLADEGLLRFEANPAHKRSPLLVLTSEGGATLAAITARAKGWHAQLGRDLSEAEIARTRRLLRRVLDHLTAEDDS
jgi:DNA-binding MarR family transcriptional regulator